MYEYVIDRIEMVAQGFKLKPIIEPGEVIVRRAAEGWRFCQIYIPPPSATGGQIENIDVIFERPSTGPRDRVNSDLPPTAQSWTAAPQSWNSAGQNWTASGGWSAG